MTDNSMTLGNPNSNVILEHIHQVIGNLVNEFNIKDNYVKYDP